MTHTTLGQVRYLAGRSVVRTMRQPAYVYPPLIFPIALLAVNSAGLQASTQLPGFPSNHFLPFALAVCFMQGALFATMNAGTDLARDIQTGFLNRLALTPLRAPTLIAGHLGGRDHHGLRTSGARLSRGRADRGARTRTPEFAGAVVLLLLATLIALAFGASGLPGATNGLGESVQSLFPFSSSSSSISSMNAPRNLMEVTWFRRRSDPEPGLVSDRERAEPRSSTGLEPRGARPSASGLRSRSWSAVSRRLRRYAREADANMSRS